MQDTISEISSYKDGCQQCTLLQQEIQKLRDKITKQSQKYHSLQKKYDDLLLANQLLEEENKLYATTRAPVKVQSQTPWVTNNSQQIKAIMDDFDSLLAIQSVEINTLMEGRDKLSTLCFRALATIDKQASTISKLKSIIESLISGQYSAVSQDLSYFGFNTNINIISKKTTPIDFHAQFPQSDILAQALNEAQNDPESLIQIGEMFTSQLQQQKKLKAQLKQQSDENDILLDKLNILMTEINPENKKSIKRAALRVRELKERIQELEAEKDLPIKLIRTFLNFGERFPNDQDVQKCIMRIKFWLDNKITDVDVIQEVDFLLGLCLKANLEEKDPDPYVDPELVKEVGELKVTVKGIKKKIEHSRKRSVYA